MSDPVFAVDAPVGRVGSEGEQPAALSERSYRGGIMSNPVVNRWMESGIRYEVSDLQR